MDDEVNEGAAWTYPAPMEAAENVRGYIAFWKEVEVKICPHPIPEQSDDPR